MGPLQAHSCLADVKRADRPCAMITVNFASRERLIEAPGMLSFATLP
ncbi:MAG: hypothetical protein ABSA02_06740 [Trebonia sp.]